jgi:hypothetical protein
LLCMGLLKRKPKNNSLLNLHPSVITCLSHMW